MKRIAAPIVGGVTTSAISVLVAYPAIYYLWRPRGLQRWREIGNMNLGLESPGYHRESLCNRSGTQPNRLFVS